MELKEIFFGISPLENRGFSLLGGEKPFEVNQAEDVMHEGDIVVLFANAFNDAKLVEKTKKTIETSLYSNIGIDEQLMSCFSALCDLMDNDLFVRLIMMNNINEYISGKKKKISTLRKEITEHFFDLCYTADIFAQALSATGEKGDFKKWLLLDVESQFSKESDIFYKIIPGLQNGEFAFAEMFIINNSHAAIYFDAVQIIKRGIQIKKCQNCKRYFVPLTRSDEIYCDSIFENGKTCKQLGYENKVKNDEILCQYRKIYKTQNARKQRNSHIPQIAERFKTWADFAKKQLEACQRGEQSLENMVAAISGDSWMKEGANHADDSETR